MELLTLNSTDELRAAAPAWNNLWQRSDCAWPTMRAEPLAQWLDTFACGKRFRALCVHDDRRMIAALPLFGDCMRRVLPIGRLPDNDLCSVGDLLLDKGWESDAPAEPLEFLIRGIRKQPWPLLCFDAMLPQSKRWQAFTAALEAAHMPTIQRRRGVTGLIDITGDWDSYFATRSRNHRRHMRVVASRANDEGEVKLKLLNNPTTENIERFLRRGFEVEDRSWKGPAGTSVLKTPGAFAYFVEQAKLVAASGHLVLAFLELNNKAIAFEYGWLAKGVYHSLKVGYDAAYEQLSPGQLLRSMMIERFHETRKVRLLDYLGPICDATAKWTTRSYPVDRLIVGNGLMGRALMWTHRTLRREHNASESSPVPPQPQRRPNSEPAEPVVL